MSAEIIMFPTWVASVLPQAPTTEELENQVLQASEVEAILEPWRKFLQDPTLASDDSSKIANWRLLLRTIGRKR